MARQPAKKDSIVIFVDETCAGLLAAGTQQLANKFVECAATQWSLLLGWDEGFFGF